MLTKPLILVITVLLSFTLLFGYLSYNFYGKKVDAESKLSDIIKQLSALQESYDLQAKSCLIADQVNAELLEENKKLVKEKESILDKINKIPSKPHPVAKGATNETRKATEDEIDIDARLPSELRSLLSDAYNSLQGQTNADAR